MCMHIELLSMPFVFSLIETRSDQDFVAQAKGLMERIILAGIKDRGFAIIGLSGGSTPGPVYAALGASKAIDWAKVWVFLMDDRYIREDSPHSNQFLVRSTLLREAPVPESQLVFPDTALPYDECVALYGRHVKDLLAKGAPDVVTLGMGDDCHTTSLFPPLPEAAFGPATVIATHTDRFDIPQRISTTVPVLQKAQQHLLLLKGTAKRAPWEKVVGALEDIRQFPLHAALKEGRMTVVGQW